MFGTIIRKICQMRVPSTHALLRATLRREGKQKNGKTYMVKSTKVILYTMTSLGHANFTLK